MAHRDIFTRFFLFQFHSQALSLIVDASQFAWLLLRHVLFGFQLSCTPVAAQHVCQHSTHQLREINQVHQIAQDLEHENLG